MARKELQIIMDADNVFESIEIERVKLDAKKALLALENHEKSKALF